MRNTRWRQWLLRLTTAGAAGGPLSPADLHGPTSPGSKRPSTVDSTSQEQDDIAGNVNDSGPAREGEGFGQ